MRVLAGRRHAHRPRPVVVEVGQLVGQLLDVLGRQARGVLDDVVAGGVDGALPHRLRDQEEVVPEDDGSGRRWMEAKNIREVKEIFEATDLSGRVTVVSTTVPLGGLLGFFPCRKNLVLILLLTMM